MKIAAFLIVNDNGAIRAVKSYRELQFNEIAVQVNLEVPDQLFRKPVVSADIVVPEDAVQTPEISAEVTENIKEAIETATGVEVKISIPDPE